MIVCFVGGVSCSHFLAQAISCSKSSCDFHVVSWCWFVVSLACVCVLIPLWCLVCPHHYSRSNFIVDDGDRWLSDAKNVRDSCRVRCVRTSFGVVVVGWLGRASTTLHCTHPCADMEPQETPQCLFLFPPSLALWLARCPLQPGKLQWAWLAGHSPTLSGVSSVRGMRALPRSGNSTGSLPQLLL